VLHRPGELDIHAIIAANKMAMHGNMDVYMRFVALQGPDGMLSIRTMGSAPKAPKNHKLRR
jgi:hypothetical protein